MQLAALGRFEVWKVFICEAPQPKYTLFDCCRSGPCGEQRPDVLASVPACCVHAYMSYAIEIIPGFYEILPDFVAETLKEGIVELDNKLKIIY